MSAIVLSKQITTSNGPLASGPAAPPRKNEFKFLSINADSKSLASSAAQEAALECRGNPDLLRAAGRPLANAVKADPQNENAQSWARDALFLLEEAALAYISRGRWHDASKCYLKAAHTLVRASLNPEKALSLCLYGKLCLNEEGRLDQSRDHRYVIETLTSVKARIHETEADAYGQLVAEALTANPSDRTKARDYSQARADSLAEAARLYLLDLSKDPQCAEAMYWQAAAVRDTRLATALYSQLGHDEAAKGLHLTEAAIRGLLAYSRSANGQINGEQHLEVDQNRRRLQQEQSALFAAYPSLVLEPIVL